jgi:cell fate regulator YaaT (PSP1 superfamily)
VVAEHPQVYLVNHGSAAELGSFQTAVPLLCQRGDRVVIGGPSGLKVGTVLCEANPRHLRLLNGTPLGQLLRLATAEDEQIVQRMRERSQEVFADCGRLAVEMTLPLTVIDVEMSLDGHQAVVHYLGPKDADINAFAASLARRHGLFVLMHNLALPFEEDQEGCGEPNCGRANGGSCANCASGGCATGCGSTKTDMRDYFAHLRARMEQRNLTPLL